MGKTTIEWTDESWNPIRGTKGRWHCTKVSEGCRSCYAERMNKRWGGPEYKPGADTFQLNERILNLPLGWKKPRKVFVCDMTDLFHEGISDRWLDQIFDVMEAGEGHWHEGEGQWTHDAYHTFQVLTKRPQRMLDYMTKRMKKKQDYADQFKKCPTPEMQDSPAARAARQEARGEFMQHIWLGVSVEDQKTADKRIPLLLQTPAAVRFVSYEPALGPVDFRGWFGNECENCGEVQPTRVWHGIDWIIIGGESGHQARPFDVAWARSAIAQCKAAGVACFMKQLGRNVISDRDGPHIKRTTMGVESYSYLTAHPLKHPKGGDPSEWPEDLRVREFPL